MWNPWVLGRRCNLQSSGTSLLQWGGAEVVLMVHWQKGKVCTDRCSAACRWDNRCSHSLVLRLRFAELKHVLVHLKIFPVLAYFIRLFRTLCW
jgi:hypothetical protein